MIEEFLEGQGSEVEEAKDSLAAIKLLLKRKLITEHQADGAKKRLAREVSKAIIKAQNIHDRALGFFDRVEQQTARVGGDDPTADREGQGEDQG